MKKISRTLIAVSAATVFAMSMAVAPAAADGHGGPQGKQLGKLAQQCASDVFDRESIGASFGSRPHGNMRGGVPAYLKAHCGD